MAEFYKILKADKLGDPWTPNAPGAKPVQNWWCQVEGLDKDVSIGKQVGNDLRPGMHVYGDLKYAKSQKGTEYWKFQSQQIPDDVQRPVDDPATPAQATAQASVGEVGGQVPGWFIPFANQLADTHRMVKNLHGDFDGSVSDDKSKQEDKKPTKVEHIGGEPLDEETQAALNGIFGSPETPEDV